MDKITEKIGFIGSGNMCEALAGGLINKQTASKDQIFCSNPSEGRLKIMKEKFDVTTFGGQGSNIEVVKNTQIVVLAVKPVYLIRVLEEIKPHLTEDHLVLSIVAGVTIDTIAKEINGHQRIARLVVNTPALLGCGAGAYAMADGARPEDSNVVKIFMNAVGISFELAERLMDSVTGVSGSGPAYVFIFIEALADGAVK